MPHTYGSHQVSTEPQAANPDYAESLSARSRSSFFGVAKSTRWGDRVFYHVTRATAFAIIILAALLVIDLLRGSWEAIGHFGFRFLTGTTWDPVAQEFGVLPPAVGTLVKSLIGLLIAVPISFGSAIFIAFYIPKHLRAIISYPIELLAGIPSIIFGLWGLLIMVPVVRVVQVWLKANFGGFPLFDGPAVYGVGVLAGALMLAIMITPIITAISRDILLTVPRTQIEAMLALGATQWEAIWKVALPYARSGLIGAVILGLGRSIGETMAVTMVGGNNFNLPKSLFDPVHSMASLIASEFAEATYSLYVSSLIYVGLVLFAITFVISLLAQLLIWRLSKGRVAILD
jgi:phosphate transport system permease protein